MQVGSRTQNPNKLTTYIMVSLFLGIGVGYACNTLASPEQAKVIAGYFAIVSDIFLRMIKMIIAPLVFATMCPEFPVSAQAAVPWDGSPSSRWPGSSPRR